MEGVSAVWAVLSAIAAATAGLWTFYTSVKDRAVRAQIDGTKALASAADNDELRRFGEQEWQRANFKLVTGMDGRGRYAALIQSYRDIGAHTYAWQRLGRVDAYLVDGKDVRRLTARDGLAGVLALVVGVGSLAGSMALLKIAIEAALSVSSVVVSLGWLVLMAATCAWIAAFAVVGMSLLLFVINMVVSVPSVRRELAKGRAAHDAP